MLCVNTQGMTQLIRPKRRVRSYMPSPSSLANLVHYKKGQNGHGRVYPLKERLRHALDHPLKEPKPDAPHGDVIVYNTLKGAAELVPVAFRETWDRVEGKVPDKTIPQVAVKVLFIIGKGYQEITPKLIERGLTNGDE